MSFTPGSHTRVADRESAYVRAFCESVVSGGEPQLLAVDAAPGAPENDCFKTVERRVADAGGTAAFGWAIWEWPGTYIEAEFHAVWRVPDGVLHDISPAPQNIAQRLFLIDPRRRYEGKQVKNIRHALTDHPAVRRFIAASDKLFAVMNRGPRADQHGALSIPENELEPVLREIQEAHDSMISRRVGRNDLCPCGSRRKYKRCCGA
jgi:hypothetical protein